VVTAQRAKPSCTPLESGDRLKRDEFERRYSERPDIKKAELVEGVVYVASPVRIPEHAEPHAHVVFWLGSYVARHPECRFADNGTVRLDDENELQPYAMLFRAKASGGQASIDDDGFLEGAPELIVEVAASSAAYDLGPKKEAYRRNGVREYVVWQILEGRIDWFQLTDSDFERVEPDATGVIESSVFAALRLNVPAMLQGDLAAVAGSIG